MDIEYEGGLAMDTEIDDPMNTEMKPSQIKPPQHKGGPKAGLKTVKKILTPEVQFHLFSSVFFAVCSCSPFFSLLVHCLFVHLINLIKFRNKISRGRKEKQQQQPGRLPRI